MLAVTHDAVTPMPSYTRVFEVLFSTVLVVRPWSLLHVTGGYLFFDFGFIGRISGSNQIVEKAAKPS